MPLHFIAFLLFSVLALASRHVNCLLAQLQPVKSICLPTRDCCWASAQEGVYYTHPFPSWVPTILPVILPSCCSTQNMQRISRHLDCAQQGFSTGKIGTCEIRPRVPLRAHRCTKTVLTGPLEHHPTLSRFFAKRRELSQLSQNFTLLSRDLRPRQKNKILRKRRLLAQQEC